MKKKGIWTRNFISVFLINFMLTLVFFVLVTTVVAYSIEKYNVSTSMAGLVSGVFVIGALIGRLAAGRYIQTIGSKKILLMGIILFIITASFYFISVDFSLFFMIRFFHGLAYGFASTATGTIVAQIISPAQKGEGIGYYSLSSILSTAIGPFLGILFTQLDEGFQYIFILNLILAINCLILYFFVSDPPLIHSANNEKHKKVAFKISNFIELRALPISLIAMIFGIIYSTIMSFSSYYVENIGFVKEGSLFFLIYAVVVIITRPITGKIMDAKGSNVIIYPSLILFAIGMLFYSQAQYGFMIIIAALFVGLGYGNFNSIAQTIAIKVTPHHRLSLATSTYFIFFDLGLGIGPYIFGYLIPFVGYRGVFFIAFVIILLTIVLYHLLHGRKDKVLIPVISSIN